MSGCEIFSALAGCWAIFVTVLYFKADNEATDRQGWIDRTQREIQYMQRRHPDIWRQVEEKMASRYLDEGDPNV